MEELKKGDKVIIIGDVRNYFKNRTGVIVGFVKMNHSDSLVLVELENWDCLVQFSKENIAHFGQ